MESLLGLEEEKRESVACEICGRELTNPLSIERRVGPVCVRRSLILTAGMEDLPPVLERHSLIEESSE